MYPYTNQRRARLTPKPSDTFNYFSVCEACTDSECCAEPYFTFCARNEIQKIKDFIKDFPQKFQNFLDIDTITYNNKQYKYYGFNKNEKFIIFIDIEDLETSGKIHALIQELMPKESLGIRTLLEYCTVNQEILQMKEDFLG